jgi:hypothetical protein
MITQEERRSLSLFSENIFDYGCDRNCVIVDAGTFLGSSTTSLADGLSRSGLSSGERNGRIWCYDLFRATPAMVTTEGYLKGAGIPPGGSFRGLFDAYTSSIRDYLKVHEGDIAIAPVPTHPISILFLDIMWSWESAIDIAKRFYPLLQNKKSLLIHQDFCYPFYPWVVIHMGLLEEYCRVAYTIPFSSMVFDVIRSIPESAIRDPRDVDHLTVKAIYQRFADIADRWGWGKGALWLSFCIYMASLSKFDEAFATYALVEEAYANDPLVAQYFPTVKGYCDAAAESGNPPLLRGGA